MTDRLAWDVIPAEIQQRQHEFDRMTWNDYIISVIPPNNDHVELTKPCTRIYRTISGAKPTDAIQLLQYPQPLLGYNPTIKILKDVENGISYSTDEDINEEYAYTVNHFNRILMMDFNIAFALAVTIYNHEPISKNFYIELRRRLHLYGLIDDNEYDNDYSDDEYDNGSYHEESYSLVA